MDERIERALNDWRETNLNPRMWAKFEAFLWGDELFVVVLKGVRNSQGVPERFYESHRYINNGRTVVSIYP